MMDKKVSVIIPTINAEHELPILLGALRRQDHPINEIIVIDSDSNDRTKEICEADPSIIFIQIKRKEFDHGKTRDLALRQSTGEFVVFLTQDAIPVKKDFLSKLLAPLSKDKVAISSGRQIPKNDATRMEKLVRAFNYPETGYIRSKEDLPIMGIKTFFCSDVCAAYNRTVYLQLGGFDYPIKTNEDMFFAAKVINAGYRISYTADAIVYHSHNFSLREQYQRNYLQGYEIERHRKELNNIDQKSEGIKLVKYVSKELLKKGYIGSLICFGFDCLARLMGSRSGKKAYRKEADL